MKLIAIIAVVVLAAIPSLRILTMMISGLSLQSIYLRKSKHKAKNERLAGKEDC
jgi:hypothetical protein